jgi:hypothetical protein
MTYGCEAAPRLAEELGFEHVVAKLWWADDATLEIEKRNLEAEVDQIDAIVVGNETVHKAVARGQAAPGATPTAQALFFQRLIESGEPFVYGFAFDAYFAAKTSPPGGFGGLWDADLNPKPAVSILDLGPWRLLQLARARVTASSSGQARPSSVAAWNAGSPRASRVPARVSAWKPSRWSSTTT